MSNLKNSKRLSFAYKKVYKENALFWDLCCDHGRLGIALLKDHKKVHFVDQVIGITKRLEALIEKDSDIPAAMYKVTTKDILKLNKTDISNQINYFMLLGVGADLIINFLKTYNFNQNDQFLLCAHQRSYKLREFLKKSTKFKLKDELLLEENEQFYDFLFLDFKGKSKVSLIPSKFNSIREKKKFCQKEIEFFTIKAQYDPHYQTLLDSYLDIL